MQNTDKLTIKIRLRFSGFKNNRDGVIPPILKAPIINALQNPAVVLGCHHTDNYR
jgi:hypothetical protein